MEKYKLKISSSDLEFLSFEELFDAKILKSNDCIILEDDLLLESPVVFPKSCVVDLNHHCIYTLVSNCIVVKNGLDVCMKNGKIFTSSADQIANSIVVQGKNTKLTLGPDLQMNTAGTAVYVRRKSTLEVVDCNICGSGTQPTLYIQDPSTTCIIFSGDIKSCYTSSIVANTESKVIIEGGNIISECDDQSIENSFPAICISSRGTQLSMIDGCILSKYTSSVILQSGGQFELNGGVVRSYSKCYPAIQVQDDYSDMRMNGGEIYASYSCWLSNKIDPGQANFIYVHDGKMCACNNIFEISEFGDHSILIDGGRIKGKLDSQFIAEGYKLSSEPDEEGYYSIVENTEEDENVEPDVINDDSILLVPSDLSILPKNVPDVDTSILPLLPEDTSIIPDVPNIPDNIPEDYSDISFDFTETSVVIHSAIKIFRTPSYKSKFIFWQGTLLLINNIYKDFNNNKYMSVKFKLPGSGVVSTGYVTLSSVSKYIMTGGVR